MDDEEARAKDDALIPIEITTQVSDKTTFKIKSNLDVLNKGRLMTRNRRGNNWRKIVATDIPLQEEGDAAVFIIKPPIREMIKLVESSRIKNTRESLC